MILNVVREDIKKNKINNVQETDTVEIKRIKELLNENALVYVSSNIRNILNLTKPNESNCFEPLDKKIVIPLNDTYTYIVILYIRLSVEDGDLIDGDVSKSIRNQLIILLDECRKRNWQVVGIFCEEGISGAEDNRPEWIKALKFCECGRTQILFCKSQSRFSRSLEMVEKYVHNKFIEWNIRFVGLVDSADTSIKGNKKARQINGLVNEWQVEDQSINTREVLRKKKENGLYASAFCPYGYVKAPDDKYRLIIDEEAANVVRRIFDMYSKGFGCNKICNILNKEKIPTPLEYKHTHGLQLGSRISIKKTIMYQTEKNETISSLADKFFTKSNSIIVRNDISDDMFITFEDNIEERLLKENVVIKIPQKDLWSEPTVLKILRDETYLGYLVLGKTKKKSYKDSTKLRVPKEEWIKVPHCHTPIISRELWNLVNINFSKDLKIKPQADGTINIFSKKVFCSCCGNAFQKAGKIRNNEDDYYLRCRQKIGGKSVFCNNNGVVRASELKKIIIEKINMKIKNFYDYSLIEKDYYENKVKNTIEKDIETLNEEKVNIQKLIQKKNNMLNILFEDRATGLITPEEFSKLKNKNALDLEDYSDRLCNIEKSLIELENKKDIKINNKKLFEKYKEITELDRVCLNEFIDKIYIGKIDSITGKREIEIIWNIDES